MTGVRGGVVDPSCGAGALLAPYVRRRVRAAQDARATLDEIASSVAGTDLDPIGVWLGNALLAGELLPLWGRLTEAERQRTPLPRLLDVGDGLAPRRDGPQVIVMNPPYGRVRLEPSQRERWASTLCGHANRYALFLHAAVERAAEGGVVAAVIPTSFLGGAYFQRLRGFLARNAPLVRVVFVDARAGVFVGDVLQETCLAIFHKGGARADVVCGQVSVNGRATRRALPRTPARLERIEEPWLLPRAGVSGALVRRAAALRSCLADYGWSASTGPLVWNRHKVQISPRQAGGAVPILWGADIAAGRVARDVARDHQRFISLRPRDTFMRLDEPCVLVQRTTAPEQPRRLVAAVLDAETLEAWGGCVVVENHVNVLRSRFSSLLI